jgi:hypothetical protein
MAKKYYPLRPEDEPMTEEERLEWEKVMADDERDEEYEYEEDNNEPGRSATPFNGEYVDWFNETVEDTIKRYKGVRDYEVMALVEMLRQSRKVSLHCVKEIVRLRYVTKLLQEMQKNHLGDEDDWD